MNVFGHTFVALAVGDDDPAYMLGAVLPDLAPMLDVRIDRSRLDGRVGDGVRCHIEADAVFHALPQFRSGAAALRRDLAEGGLERGPVRAVGHAGWELLLDGALVGSAAETAYWRALGAGDSVIDAIAEPDRSRWLRFLGHRHPRGRWPLRYDDPTWVAERLHALLARRPRLAFPREQLGDVARVLDGHARHVAAVAPEVLAATAGPLVRARPRPP
jgi:hypothetical protein